MKRWMTSFTLALLILLLVGCAQQTGRTDDIGLDAAKALALEAADVSESAASFTTAELEQRDGLDYYAISFTANGAQFAYDIDAITGIVIASHMAASGGLDDGTSESADVDEAKAKEIALTHAGLSGDQVTFVKSKLERDDGRQIYEVEFYTTDFMEYDYEIDAVTGDIISYDQDAEGYMPPASNGGSMTAEGAKEVALAQVPGAAESDIGQFETDYVDGCLVYEGTIYYSGMEYEFEIDGYSGALRSWEAEPIDH